jgi:hypothetical protein
MFNLSDIFFGEKPVYPDPTSIKPVKVPSEKVIEPAFQVGRTEDNRVSLKLGGDNSWSSSLLMNNEGVDALIRMLEAAKNPLLPAGDSEK